ncbi:MAG: aspartate--tRNA ligase [Candidatus Eisenbacteria bacterium]|uniref:Aspartate--tRNA(Asp/Asn) ligase n=1 Tax=Eiseniibacteriota bacterium TaxID=2212470 RepID=A0A7Y2E8K5_UNCEI|nr:aspartate--tRNA ligase [Candidatus Eisenbacteria bacterium]
MEADHLGDWTRSHHCGELKGTNQGETVTLMGWVQKTRDHGGVLFIDLRDYTGITQVVFHPEKHPEATMDRAKALRGEFVIAVRGEVLRRPDEMINSALPTGEIELDVKELKVLNVSLTPPFMVDDETEVAEDIRLKYRYIDLRRPSLQESLRMRAKVTIEVRKHLAERGFTEVETPLMVAPTPEGARDYIVPARLHPGKFYALPQSPQLYKQILMVSGIDKYFQIARCLRDEDLRADRQPEHTQIDIEMSYVREDDVFALLESLMSHVFKSCLDIELETPFLRMKYRDAMDTYGTDKPDLRFDLKLQDVSSVVGSSEFKVFAETVSKGGVVKALRVPEGATKSRKEITNLEEIAKRYGAKGLAWSKVTEAGLEGGIGKFLSSIDAPLREHLGAEVGDLLLFVADSWLTTCRSLGAVRSELGEPLIEGREKEFRFLWVREFPLFEYNSDRGAWEPAHHMFSMPMEEHLDYLETDPGKVHAQLYDLVVNGVELASGSVRIHRRDIQERVMKVIGMSLEEAERKFGFLLEAFQYGAPPHGGIAPGLDRLIMVMTGRRSLRDVIAFPKTARAASLMDGAPAEVDNQDLQDLSIKVLK